MAIKHKGSMTLAEHEAWLREIGEWDAYVARKKEKKEALQRQWDEWRHAEAPLVEELHAAGFEVRSVWELVSTATPYTRALPILVDHLNKAYPSAVRDGIVRALAVKEASFAWDTLIKLLREEQEGRVKDAAAVAIAVIANDDLIDEVVSLAQDTKLGASRLLLLRALEHSSSPRARKALMDLGTDPDLVKEIQVILRRLKSAKTKSKGK
jgi:hypothetical protein